ncbi:hypothetical protein [Psychrobacter sp. FDAARGOS_221]|uniref:hypothetical protein n=1 Tax=Psychrobacter sp. FDAARGOS_221 TaxID=1975705 RepID=UPI000BB5947F|nr:hypothetical protein [Psychrobacter sp. FDAARGOS_221]PNK59515.1 hypothetical protein A6J60_000525 [Psychrobacter sp. FDAARGOS_221]
MMLSHTRSCARSKVVGIVLLSTLTAVGCNKNPDAEEGGANQQQVDNVLVPVVACDDRMVAAQLEQAVKANLSTQAQRQFNAYAESAGETLSTSNLNKATTSVLVDVANPVMIAEANDQGMVTCSASLSLTLPNQDVARATKVYSALEDRSLESVLQAQNISLNNNMLVASGVNYMVGMQGGQTRAHLVGQPTILVAASDMLAKSQFQSTLDATLATPRVRQPKPEPSLPKEPTIRSEPQVRPEPEPRAAAKKSEPTKTAPAKSRSSESAAPKKSSSSQLSSSQSVGPAGQSKSSRAEPDNNKASNTRSQAPAKSSNDASDTQLGPAANNKVVSPKEKAPVDPIGEKIKEITNNDEIDVVIIEEEGTY